MKIDYLFNQDFAATQPFGFYDPNKRKNVTCVQYRNELFESLKQRGLDIHYEIQQNQDETVDIYLDCHAFPYGNFKNNKGEAYANALKTYYSEQKANEILEYRDKLKDLYLAIGKTNKTKYYYYGQRNINEYLRLVSNEKINITSEEQLLTEVYKFIANTYVELIDNLKKVNLIWLNNKKSFYREVILF